MCGICGFLNFNYELGKAQSVVKKMCRTMHHRGPDDEGYYFGDHVALGMRRLSIIDVEGGHQPVFNENKTMCSVINGEIYNYRELKGELEKKGHRFLSNSDSEVLIHLYEEYGVECLDKMNGMFAFAIWDGTAKILFVARDRIGIKPLYYHFNNGKFVFGSELKSLLEHPAITKKIDYKALSQYLTYEYVPAPRSILKDINKLSPGHFIVIDSKDQLTIKQYWDYNFSDKLVFNNENECVELLLGKFHQAVKRRMISDVPLGTFLSGGIDSGMIAAAMKNISPGLVDSFNIGFKEKSFDESEYAGNLAGFLGLNHRSKICDSSDMLALLPKLTDILDEPLGDNSVLPTYLLSQFCREHVTVALSGDGGDELFAGYPTYQAHKFADIYRRYPGYLGRNLLDKCLLNLPVSTKNFSFDFKVKKFISGIDYPDVQRHSIWLGSFSPHETVKLFHPSINEELQGYDVFEITRQLLKSARVTTRLDAILYLDMKLYLQEDLLVKVDRTSMANSLEVRVPFLDHEFVDFATRLPDNLKLRLFKTKYLLKKAAKESLPSKVIHRSKKGFGAPVASWIKNELKEMFCDTFSKDKVKREGLFQYPYIKQLLDDHFNGKSDNRQKLWTLFVFEKWYENYM